LPHCIPGDCDRERFAIPFKISFGAQMMPVVALSRVPGGGQTLVVLGSAPIGFVGRICEVKAPVDTGGLSEAELERRLIELGFVEGALVEVLHQGPFGRDPIAIRVDESTVAVRRRDASAIMVQPEASSHPFADAAE
jgi:ferrous iron transport protein A